MAVTILERPEGHVLSSTENTATVSESYGTGDASFVDINHGLSDGDYIYAVSTIENYAGFWYVDIITADIFKIKPNAAGDYVQYIQDGSITWYLSSLTHGWSAVHLPITYRISNDLYPTNSADTTRNITSVTNYNGFSVLHLSGSLGSGVNSYDFVKVTLPNDTELSGVYQIVEFVSPTVLIINLEYDSSNNFTSATALKHYNNYNIIVRVYAGINSSHEWATQKPYELAATKEFIPDEDNEVFFSISDILKSYIETRNNTTLGTLPNNIDLWTNFYIEVAEQYDDSDGYTFGTFTSGYTSDQSEFEGVAVNAKLDFKNIHSGYMSDYMMGNTSSKFLTLFTDPVIFDGFYQDISFLKPDNYDYILFKQYYLNGAEAFSESETISGDYGVYRVRLTANCDYDRVDIKLMIDPVDISGAITDVIETVDGDIEVLEVTSTEVIFLADPEVCEGDPEVVYFNGAFAPGTILYADAALSINIVNVNYVADILGTTNVYEIDPVTGEIGVDTGFNCAG